MMSFQTVFWTAWLASCLTAGSEAFVTQPFLNALSRPKGQLQSSHKAISPPSPSSLSFSRSRRFRSQNLQASTCAAAFDPWALDPLEDNELNLNSFFSSARRIVAVGDIHGSSRNFLKCLRTAGVADENGDWCGGDTVLVQVGDILDRGVDEAGCMEMLLKLRKQSRQAGGNVIFMLGNHEILNADLDFRYAKVGQFTKWKEESGVFGKIEEFFKGKRQRIFQRGRGSMAMIMSTMPVVVQIGDTVFCHGGLTWATVQHGFQALNDDTSEWLQGTLDEKPRLLEPIDCDALEASPLWERAYSSDKIASKHLKRADNLLRIADARNMVVGHTPQASGVNGVESKEGRQVWRVDTALADSQRGRIECLEILQAANGETECMTVIGEHGDMDAHLRLSRHPGKRWLHPFRENCANASQGPRPPQPICS